MTTFKFDINFLLRSILFSLLLQVYFQQPGFSQAVGNEWIDFNQTYYKLPVAEDGIYRLNYDDLLSHGFPVSSVDPRRIQIFHKGVEQAIFIKGQEDARIHQGDYIEFYGLKNDGSSETELYIPNEAQPHTYYSLYTDTAAYFLTWKLSATAGKRMTSFIEANVNNLPAQTHHRNQNILIFKSDYASGRVYPEGSNDEVILSHFDYGEGWTGPRIRKGQFGDYSLSGINSTFTSGTKPVLELLLTGRNNRRHNVSIQLGSSISTLRTLPEVTFNYYNTHLVRQEIEWSDISAGGELFLRVNVIGFPETDADFVSVTYLKLNYPQQIDFAGETKKSFYLNPNPAGKSYVEFLNTPASSIIYDITDKDNVTTIGTNSSSGKLLAIVPGTQTGKKLYVLNGEDKKPSMKRVKFRNITPTNHNYLMISHKKLMQSSGQDPNPVKSFGTYRASAAGGNYDTLIMDIQQIYDQFGYGLPIPIALKRFVRFMVQGGDPQYLFLIGKALHVGHDYYRKPADSYIANDLVPTMGYPGSDILFSSGLNGTRYDPAVPTGRLNANTPSEVTAYLNKVIETESKPFDDLRRKHLIHLSGGVTAGELRLFKQFVDDFKVQAENHHLGGKVTTISKSTNNSVELININEEVNDGVSLITFFGHSSPTIVDIEIGYVSNDGMGYRNKNKYPVLLVNGCNAGNVFGTTLTFGEDWIATPDRGAIGVLAHSSFGYVGPLKRYSELFYRIGFEDSTFIHKSLGEIQKETTKRYVALSDEVPLHITQVQQMILQGDPAVRLFGADKPDYSVQDNNLFLSEFEGIPITALADSFAIGVVVKNFGRTSLEPITIEVKRTFSDGRTAMYDPVVFDPVKYQDTLYYTIKSKDAGSFGNNRFEVFVDNQSIIQELSENNNSAILNYFIPLSGITNVLPVDYGILNNPNPVLIAQSTDLLSKQRDYYFELDTAYNFNSSFKKQATINAKSLASWEVNLIPVSTKDSVVYYWRTKFAQPLVGEDTSWIRNSFIYIDNSPEGYSQATFPQFYNNGRRGLIQDKVTKTWKFEEPEGTVKVKTFGENHPDKNYTNVEVELNGVPYLYSGRLCADNALHGIAFDQSSLGAYQVLNRRSCGRWPVVINNFIKVEIESDTRVLNEFIQTVPDGDYVLLFSMGRVTYESWPADVRAQMMNIGASAEILNALKNGDPYIILGRKGGASGSAIEVVGDAALGSANVQEIILDQVVKGKYTQGSITSTKIGPASSWGSFFQEHKIPGDPANDVVYFNIYGVNYEGNETLLKNGIMAEQLALDDINSSEFPYLRLRAEISDPVNFTPAQLKKWQVLYEGVPEGVLTILGEEDQKVKGLQKQEGEEFEVSFNFQNVSNKDFSDSIQVRYTFFNHTSRTSDVKTLKLAPLKVGQKEDFTIFISTVDRGGMNSFNVYVNPQVLPEQNYNNNIIDLPEFFEVQEDNANPVLDVAFDGVYIMDGDIVSPNPLISVKLKDENKFLFKKDTTGLELYLKRPCESCMFEKVDLKSQNVTWTPAEENSDFQLEYHAKDLEDGVYALKVQGTDASGNKSGLKPYIVNFEVINKSEITNFYPYPNPFSTSTRFVFTLTGSEIPQEIKIQIMTVTGKVVREITQDELGPLRIGNNLSQFAWNGRDEFGDQLANGVYLYRVIVKNNGQDMEKRSTAADKGFKKGFGKMYLLK